MGQGSGPAHRLTSTERLELQQRVRAGETHVEAGISVAFTLPPRQTWLKEPAPHWIDLDADSLH